MSEYYLVASSSRPLVGVNFGGWLVLERWMTPALFAGTDAGDEHSFMQTDGALAKLRRHQREFIQEEDWQWLQQNGIEAVRLPIGYWVFDGAGPLKPCIGKVDWAVRMAEKYDIKLLLCLHGAPGSQNGHHHSGKAGASQWYDKASYQKQTTKVLVRLAERYASKPAVWGIELLNEPRFGTGYSKLKRFHTQAYQAMTRLARPGLVIVFSDAFSPRLMSGTLRAKAHFPVAMDHHWYHFFVFKHLQRFIPFAVYGWWLEHVKAPLLGRLSRAQPIIIGEWNGIIGGEKLSRYPKQRHAEIVGWHIRLQQKAFDGTLAHFYWSYKTQERGVYHFRSMVEDGAINI